MDALKPQRNEPARMEGLAKLPVFWRLEGKRVVLAGGSDGAAWKAELLLACGAQLDLYCEESGRSESLATLVAKSPMLTWHDRCWDADIFKGAELALADCETEEEAGRFYDAARTAGVPVNVIDKPEFCQFQFGSIVNRSPVPRPFWRRPSAGALRYCCRFRSRIGVRLPRQFESVLICGLRLVRHGAPSGKNSSTGLLPKGWTRVAKNGC
jgi:hypothetical protein